MSESEKAFWVLVGVSGGVILFGYLIVIGKLIS